MRKIFRGSRLVVASLAAGALTFMTVAPAAASPVAAPGRISVERDEANPTTIVTKWAPKPGTQEVRVSIFDGSTEWVRSLPPDVTELAYPGEGVCTSYRVNITAVGDNGTTAKAGTVLVGRLAPGGLSSITGDRNSEGTTGTISWGAPRDWGAGDNPSYAVRVTELATGSVLVDTTTTDTSVTLDSLDPARMYVANVTPQSSMGSCFTSKHVLAANRSGGPTGLEAVRDDVPSTVHLSWDPPQWSGYGQITHYKVYYGDSRVTDTIDVQDTQVTLEGFDPEKDSKFQVVAYSGAVRGQPSKPHTLDRIGAPGTPETLPEVNITENGGVVDVNVAGPVGKSQTFPTMKMEISSADGGSYQSEHVIANRAERLNFDKVPCGVYAVTVTGVGETSSQEFGRALVNRCQTGELTPAEWRLVHGRADISGNVVDMRYGNESRVLSKKAQVSQDQVVTTKATLHSGMGYGIWLRGSLPDNARNAAISGWSMQYDPGYGRINSFGPALLLRVWDNGRECSTPVERVKWPEGLDTYTEHKISAQVQGDSLYMTIDGKRLFSVGSLTESLQKSGCAQKGFREPTGDQVGFRTWGGDTKAIFKETTLN